MPVSQRRAAMEENAPSHDLFLATGAGSINDLSLYFSLAWLADLTLFPDFSIACGIETNDLLVAEKTEAKMASSTRRQPGTMIDIESTLLFQNRRGNRKFAQSRLPRSICVHTDDSHQPGQRGRRHCQRVPARYPRVVQGYIDSECDRPHLHRHLLCLH